MIKRIFLVMLLLALLIGLIWVTYGSFINQFVNPEKVFVFYFDIFGFLSASLFGLIGLILIGFFYRLAEAIKNKDLMASGTKSEKISGKIGWISCSIFAIIGLTINYTNYFINIQDKGFVSCEFVTQRHKDWMLNKYARIQEDCEKEGIREVSN